MMASSRKTAHGSLAEVIQLPINLVIPNPFQPRTQFEPQGLRELAFSIEQHGILQPLSVRQIGKSYELIAGERRLRAAKLAGLSVVPCILITADDTEASLLSLVENLQRRDLDFFEIAFCYQRLIQVFRLTQEQTALRVGKSQSAVANKLRLLRFDSLDIAFIRASGLTERHCRSVLRLPSRFYHEALEYITARSLTVAQTEEYVDNLLHPITSPPESADEAVSAEDSYEEQDTVEAAPLFLPLPASTTEEESLSESHQQQKMLVKDIRIFLNSIHRTYETMRNAGIDVACEEHDYDGYTELILRIPQNSSVKKTKKSCLY